MTNYLLDRLTELKQKYNPDHDLGPDAPVIYEINLLVESVLALSAEVEELKTRIGKLQPDYYR